MERRPLMSPSAARRGRAPALRRTSLTLLSLGGAVLFAIVTAALYILATNYRETSSGAGMIRRAAQALRSGLPPPLAPPPAPPVPPAPQRIVWWHAPFFSGGGMGVEAQLLVLGLQRYTDFKDRQGLLGGAGGVVGVGAACLR